MSSPCPQSCGSVLLAQPRNPVKPLSQKSKREAVDYVKGNLLAFVRDAVLLWVSIQVFGDWCWQQDVQTGTGTLKPYEIVAPHLALPASLTPGLGPFRYSCGPCRPRRPAPFGTGAHRGRYPFDPRTLCASLLDSLLVYKIL